MNSPWIAACAAALLVTASYAAEEQPKAPVTPQAADAQESDLELKTDEEKLGYAMGQNIGQNLLLQGFAVERYGANLEVVLAGIKDALLRKPSRVSQEELAAIMKEMQLRTSATGKPLSEEQVQQRKAAETFLAENAKKQAVQTSGTGLQYQIIQEGSEPKPGPQDKVKVHFIGRLMDGTEFGNTHKQNKPVTLTVNKVIAGWGEALQLMNVGSKYKLFIPPQLAYGERGSPPAIPPYAVLVFDVELVSIEPAAADAAGKDK